MPTTVEAPLELVESLRDLRFPPFWDARLQSLMDRNSDGQLSSEEREELAGLVDWSERLSLLRAEAFRLLAQRP